METINGAIALDVDETDRWEQDPALRDAAQRIFERWEQQVGPVYGFNGRLLDVWVVRGWHGDPDAREADRLRRIEADSLNALVAVLTGALNGWESLVQGVGHVIDRMRRGELPEARDQADRMLELELEATGACEAMEALDAELTRLGHPSLVKPDSEPQE